MVEELTQKDKERARLERVLLWALVSLKREEFPPSLQARYEQIRSLASRDGELSAESIRALTDDEVEDLWSIVEDLFQTE
ncbi:MAG TPA: hypothetical protein VEW48_24220 [Thermoanaerobaculia bacterium]|nr:hypothetical protein [Thermoanaerobaculia bacterium]